MTTKQQICLPNQACPDSEHFRGLVQGDEATVPASSLSSQADITIVWMLVQALLCFCTLDMSPRTCTLYIFFEHLKSLALKTQLFFHLQ